MVRNIYIYIVLAILLGLFFACSKTNNDIVVPVPVKGGDYFVATDGSDFNPGTLEKPWATWQKAVTMASPGDTVYIRGGVYMPAQHVGSSGAMFVIRPLLGIGRNGTSRNPICYFAYPGETPVLDGSLLSPQLGYNVGINTENAQYIHFRGLTVRNLKQEGVGSQAFGIDAVPCANMTFENCTVHDIAGRGFYYESGAWNVWDGPNAPFKSDTTRFINCDAYNLCDALSSNPGNAADGWKLGNYAGGVIYLDGCRAWNYSDDGIDPSGAGKRLINNCWVMSTDKYVQYEIEGNGIKTAGFGSNQLGHFSLNEHYVVITNCIAAYCTGIGFYNNLEAAAQNNALYLNNTAFRNNTGFSDIFFNVTRTSEYRNNIAIYHTSPDYEVAIYRPSIYPQSNNNWISTGLTGDISWPGWAYNSAVKVTDADFLSVDASQLTKPRKSDGSLPDISFLKLAEGSDLKGAGVYVGMSEKPDIGIDWNYLKRK